MTKWHYGSDNFDSLEWLYFGSLHSKTVTDYETIDVLTVLTNTTSILVSAHTKAENISLRYRLYDIAYII